MNSIRRTLLIWLSVGLSAGIFGTFCLVYLQARGQANDLFDYQMKQMVASLPHQAYAPLAASRDDDPNLQEDIVIQIWDQTGVRIYQSHQGIVSPQRIELGFSDVYQQGKSWRVYSAQVGGSIVQVAQPTSARRDVAAQMAIKTAGPLILLLPFLGALIWLTVGRGLASVQRAAAQVQARDAGALSPISDEELPDEIRPLTHALNDLLARLGKSIEAQRAFVADAAHELKTPLTALKLRLQLAQRAGDGPERQSAFADLSEGIDRASHLVQQLLTLARQEPGAFEEAKEAVDLLALARNAVTDFVAAAEAKQIDLGLDVDAPVALRGNGDALRTLLNNLIDNAIRYTPKGGKIDVTVQTGAAGVRLLVQDNGPGIPEAQLQRVLDRFYRVPGTQTTGSGLGLAIVKQIAAAHHAQLTLENARPGLRVCVGFGLPS